MQYNYWDRPIKVELTRFRIKSGKSERVDEWMEYLRNHLPQVLSTLDGEKIYVETIFREKSENIEYLYWYAIQGDGGLHVSESNSEVDLEHVKYSKECIDTSYQKTDLIPEVVMVPKRIQDLMG